MLFLSNRGYIFVSRKGSSSSIWRSSLISKTGYGKINLPQPQYSSYFDREVKKLIVFHVFLKLQFCSHWCQDCPSKYISRSCLLKKNNTLNSNFPLLALETNITIIFFLIFQIRKNVLIVALYILTYT